MVTPSVRARYEAHLKTMADASGIEAEIRQAFARLSGDDQQQHQSSSSAIHDWEEGMMAFILQHEGLLNSQRSLLAAMQQAIATASSLGDTMRAPCPTLPSTIIPAEGNGPASSPPPCHSPAANVVVEGVRGGSRGVEGEDSEEGRQCEWPSNRERFTLLPELMRHIISLAMDDWMENGNNSGTPTAGIRLASKGLRDEFDSLNTQIMLGGTYEPWEGEEGGDVAAPALKAGGEEEVAERIRGLLHCTPNLETLTMAPWLPKINPPSTRCWEEVLISMESPLYALLPNLVTLTLSTLSSTPGLLAPLSSLRFLSRLILEKTEVSDLSGLELCPSLERVDCFCCQKLVGLASIPSLESLFISEAWDLRDLTPLTGCTALSSLSLADCSKAEGFSTVLTSLTSLNSLTLLDCSRMESLDFLPALSSSLRSLNISSPQRSNLDLQGLSSCSRLVGLSLNSPTLSQLGVPELLCSVITASKNSLQCVSLGNTTLGVAPLIQAICSCPGLDGVHLLNFFGTCDLSPLASCTKLTSLSLVPALRDGDLDISFVGCLQGLTRLTQLALGGPGVSDALLQDLSKLPQLFSLTLCDCRHLWHLAPMASCLSLRQLTLDDCEAVQDLWDYLRKCPDKIWSFMLTGSGGHKYLLEPGMP